MVGKKEKIKEKRKVKQLTKEKKGGRGMRECWLKHNLPATENKTVLHHLLSLPRFPRFSGPS